MQKLPPTICWKWYATVRYYTSTLYEVHSKTESEIDIQIHYANEIDTERGAYNGVPPGSPLALSIINLGIIHDATDHRCWC